MAKQTFTTGQVLTAAQMTSLQQTAMGGGSTTAKTTNYVLTAADAGTVVQMNAAGATTITVNTALFSAGDTVQIQNVGAGVCTVTAGTATVVTSATLALKQYDAGTLYFNSTSAAIFFAVDAADGMNNPFTTIGDTIYSANGSTASRLAIGTAAQVLTVNAGATAPEWATASPGALTKITSASFSAASTFVVNSCFSNTYRYYLIVGRIVASATGNTTFKYRKAGTDLSTSYYYGGNRSDWSANTVSASTGNNVAGINLGSFDSYNCGFIINTSNPYSASYNPSISYQTPNTGQSYSTVGSGLRLATDTHDGFSIIPASGTLSGEVFVYGYSL
jgi:hypothetical protein